MSPPLVSVDQAAVSIGKRELLSSVSLTVARGECLGLVGETGSGKSLTCRILTGTLGRLGGRVTRGSASFDGMDLVALDERRWRQVRGHRVALVPQNSLSCLDPIMTVEHQVVETVRHLRGSSDAPRVALELLEQVQMPRASEVLRSYPHQLSGGMRQRVMIALAIAGQPELLVADEPTTALDVTVQREIMHLLTGLRRETGMSLIVVTHDLGLVAAISDRLAIMYAGATVEFGPTAHVLSHPKHPYTQALLAARPSLAHRGRRLTPVGGYPPSPEEWPAGCRFAPRCPFVQPACQDAPPALRTIEPERRVRCIRAEELVLQ
jgi:oligopeptide/dipeptide ABC transporter ATP-binding protein